MEEYSSIKIIYPPTNSKIKDIEESGVVDNKDIDRIVQLIKKI
jgi:hypothetical protein